MSDKHSPAMAQVLRERDALVIEVEMLRTRLNHIEQERLGWQGYIDLIRAGIIHPNGALARTAPACPAPSTADEHRAGDSNCQGRRHASERDRGSVRSDRIVRQQDCSRESTP
jgi:hypothetical protein